MKIVNLILCLILILLLLFGCQAEEIPQPSHTGPRVEYRQTSQAGACLLPDCDLSIALEKGRLQQTVNDNCQTMISCITCCTGGLMTFAKIYATPNCVDNTRYD